MWRIFLCLLKSHLKCNLTSADFVQSKGANAIEDLGRHSDEWFGCVIVFALHHLVYFSPVFPFLFFFFNSTSASKKNYFLFSLSQKICSEVMLGVADHILHVREGSFCLYFITVLGLGVVLFVCFSLLFFWVWFWVFCFGFVLGFFFFSWTASSC